VKEVKENVKNLRTTFHRYRKKKSGSAKGDQWVHFPSLSFLLEVDAPKRGLSTDEDIVSEVCSDISTQTDVKIEATSHSGCKWGRSHAATVAPGRMLLDKLDGKHSRPRRATRLL
jgi:hypothetical protein